MDQIAGSPARLGAFVYDSLKQDIVDLKLDPGMPLQEAEVVKLYNASRTPVREALARLAHEGFVVRWRRGYRVRSFSPDEVRELYEIREALEKMAVRLVIERASEKAATVLRDQLDVYRGFEDGRDMGAFNAHANRFHMTIAELSGNEALKAQLALIHEKVRLISARYIIRPQGIDQAHREHTRILEAIRRRDVTVAEATMREHIQSVIEYYRTA